MTTRSGEGLFNNFALIKIDDFGLVIHSLAQA